MTTTPQTTATPHEAAARAYRAVIALAERLDAITYQDVMGASLSAQITAAAEKLLAMGDDGSGQLADIVAAVRRALNAAPDDTRRPLELVTDLITAAEEAGAEIEARDIAAGLTIERRKLEGVVPVPLTRARGDVLLVHRIDRATFDAVADGRMPMQVDMQQMCAKHRAAEVADAGSQPASPSPAAMFAGQSTADQEPGIRWLAEQATQAGCLHGLTDEEMRAGDFSSQTTGLLTYLKAGARARKAVAVLQGISAEALSVVLQQLRSAPCHINLVSDKSGVIRASVGDTAQSGPADLSHFTKATLDEDGGETCRAILREALQAPPDDDRPAVALARDLVARIRQGALERLEAQRYDLGRLMGLPSPIVVAKASAPDQTLPMYYQGSKVGEAEVRSQPERSVIVVVTGEQLIADMNRGAVEVSMSDEGGPAIYVRRRPGGFTPRTEVSKVKPADFDLISPASGDQLDRIGALVDVHREPPEETDEEYRRRVLGRFKATDAGRDAGSDDPEVGALVEEAARETMRIPPYSRPPQKTAEQLVYGAAGGRQLMTAADFKTPEEFEIHRAGADRLPLGIMPGSWEGHLLTAMAAMVAAGIERHEARMAPAAKVEIDAENLFDVSYARLSTSAQTALATKAADLQKIRELEAEIDRLRLAAVEDHRRDGADRARVRDILLAARGGDADQMARALSRALGLVGGGDASAVGKEGR